MSSSLPSRRIAMRWTSSPWPCGAIAFPLPLGRRIGAHEAGRDRVDGDAELPELVGELPGQSDLARLGRGIGLNAGEADAEPGARRDHHDAALPRAFIAGATACASRISRLPPEQIEERVFEIADQLNRGATLMHDARELAALCWLNFAAGKKAKAAIAYASARSDPAQAMELLPSDAWSTRYEDAFTLSLERSECEYLVGQFERAEELFGETLRKARSDRPRQGLHPAPAALPDGQPIRRGVDDSGLQGLRLFGVSLPASEEEIRVATGAELQEVQVNLRGRRISAA